MRDQPLLIFNKTSQETFSGLIQEIYFHPKTCYQSVYVLQIGKNICNYDNEQNNTTAEIQFLTVCGNETVCGS